MRRPSGRDRVRHNPPVAFANIPLTATVLDAVCSHWDIPTASADRLPGGEESAAYRLGNHVVRMGPPWRSSSELEWCYAVVAHAGRHVPEVVAPIATTFGRIVVRIDDRPVTVWPFVSGARGDDSDRSQRYQAAGLLTRLHRCFANYGSAPRPINTSRLMLDPDLVDPELDQWLDRFAREHPVRQPLHGDFYAGNVVVRHGVIVALLDWDDMIVGPPEYELAWSAMEWGDSLWADTRDGVRRFIADYQAAGGSAKPLDDHVITQLYRGRVRWEIAYTFAARARGALHDDDDRDYENRQRDFFLAHRHLHS